MKKKFDPFGMSSSILLQNEASNNLKKGVSSTFVRAMTSSFLLT
jgi:hypothetical protein